MAESRLIYSQGDPTWIAPVLLHALVSCDTVRAKYGTGPKRSSRADEIFKRKCAASRATIGDAIFDRLGQKGRRDANSIHCRYRRHRRACLACAVGRDVAADFPDGVWILNCEEAGSLEDLVVSICAQLKSRVGPPAARFSSLEKKRFLLIVERYRAPV